MPPERPTLPAAESVLSFWLDQIGAAGWYAGGETIDAACRQFEALWSQALDGGLGPWLTDPRGALAYVILTDQLPRNMFRGRAQAFATDPQARAAATLAINQGWDLAWDGPPRQFFYLPFEHSEDASDQDRAVALFAGRMAEDQDLLLHARAHRAVIARFGRFPGRNAALGRPDSPAEATWLANGGYGAEVRMLKAGAP